MFHAAHLHLERIADSETPVVVWLRSNLTTGAGLPPVRELLDRTTVALGTGHVSLTGPSVFREMATISGAELAGPDCGLIEEGETRN